MSRSASLGAGMIALALVGCGTSAQLAGAPGRGLPASSDPFAGGPTTIGVSAPAAVRAAGGRRLAEFRLGRTVAAQSGCLACHKIGDAGKRGPGPNLTHVGSRLSPAGIERALTHPAAPMPSFSRLPPAKFKALVVFLSLLRR